MPLGAIFRQLATVPYSPSTVERPFLARIQSQSCAAVEVGCVALGPQEASEFFGIPITRRGVQPVWVKVRNRGSSAVRLSPVAISPSYFTPLEAAAINHFSLAKRLAGFGVAAWLFLPLLVLLPLKLLGARKANRRMDSLFRREAFRLGAIEPGQEASGFVYTPLDEGRKTVRIRLLGGAQPTELSFSVEVPGLDIDHRRRARDLEIAPEHLEPCEAGDLLRRLESQPRATTNRRGSREGDPVNLVVIGEFEVLLESFGARWDETETITLGTCWKTMKSFLLGREYRYSPVSPLYLFGRSQDLALQRIRGSLNERLHLRLWATPIRFETQPVWIGQVSRDIGVRFTWRTWNLTTHRVDPEVDEARDYVLEDLLGAERVDRAAYVGGVGACPESSPRRNLTGDPYFTDGKRLAVVLSRECREPRFVRWDGPGA